MDATIPVSEENSAILLALAGCICQAPFIFISNYFDPRDITWYSLFSVDFVRSLFSCWIALDVGWVCLCVQDFDGDVHRLHFCVPLLPRESSAFAR